MNELWVTLSLCICFFLWKTNVNGLKTCFHEVLLIHNGSKGTTRKRQSFPFFLFQVKKEFKGEFKKWQTENGYRKLFILRHSAEEKWEKLSEDVTKSKQQQRKKVKHKGISENKYLSQNISGISVFPLKQKGEDNQNQLKTWLPAKEFKPKKSLGQNYMKDPNVTQKIVEAVELKIESEKDSDALVKVKKESTKKQIKERKERNDKDGLIDNTKVGRGETILETNVEMQKETNMQTKKGDKKVEEERQLESVRDGGRGVIELGCGLGQLTKYLYRKYHNMTGVEIDGRALSIISRTIPNLDFIHDDVLQINYKELSINKNTKLTVVGNLPFYITTQILFCLLDFSTYIEQAIVTIQYEVGKRIVAKPNTKQYSILTILFHLYTRAYLLFKIPSKAFYPVPKVEAAVMKLMFRQKKSWNCNLLYLKQILKSAFQQKRKMLKTSLKQLIQKSHTKQIPTQFANSRPQQLLPQDFVNLTNSLFPIEIFPFDPTQNMKVWRKEKHGD